MHHDIMGKPLKGYVVDHISGDKLNNTRENLRICTHRNNCVNQQSRASNNKTSIYKGVAKLPSGRWRVIFSNNGVKVHGGVFNSEEEAANEYNRQAKDIFGEFARLNIIGQPTVIVDSKAPTENYAPIVFEHGKYKLRPQINKKRKRIGKFDSYNDALSYWKEINENGEIIKLFA